MKTSHLWRALPVAALLTSLFSLCVHAQVVANYSVAPGENAYDSTITTSLITTGQSTLGSATASAPSSLSPTFTTSGLNDASAAGNSNLDYQDLLSYDGGHLPVTFTFTLAGSATGYSLTNITSLAGWTDSNLGDQKFELELSTLATPAYTSFGTFTNNSGISGGAFSTLTSLSGTGAYLATGVTGVRFVFEDPSPTTDPAGPFPGQGGFGGTVIHELEVFGTPTLAAAPEPATYGFLVAGLLGLGAYAARRRVSRLVLP